jgi:hypothetical protein
MVTTAPATIFFFTSDPQLSAKPAQRQDGIHYAYYNAPAKNGGGGECSVSFPESVKNHVKKGQPFSIDGTPIAGLGYTTRIEFNEQYKCSFLVFDYVRQESHQEVEESAPFIPTPFPAEGWGDADSITAVAQPIRNGTPRAGVRAPQARRNAARSETEHAKRVREAGDRLNPRFKELLDEYINGQVYAAGKLGCREPIRQDTIQKHVTSVGIAYVDYLKSQVQTENIIED